MTGLPAEDLELIRRIATGDRTAMRFLYSRHQVRVHRFINGIIHDGARADDIVNEVFFEVWTQAARFEARSSVSTWILGIARFKALSVRRRRTEDELDDDSVEAEIDGTDDPEVTAQKASKAAAIRRCIAALPVDHRMVIDLVYYHEKTVEEVAEIVGANESTVKTRMFYARRKLGELLNAAGLDRGWP